MISNRIKICVHCQKEYIGCLKNQCMKCYDYNRRLSSKNPDIYKKNCKGCGIAFIAKFWCQTHCTKQCQHECHVIRRRSQYRKENNIPLDKPVEKRVKFGSGHICKKYGYKIRSKRGHPNASKNGRIYEHVLVMSEYLGRPILRGENIHHKNGVRNDNRIENLELWTTGQPSGQRVIDKIEWCLDFLKKYGEVEYKITKKFD